MSGPLHSFGNSKAGVVLSEIVSSREYGKAGTHIAALVHKFQRRFNSVSGVRTEDRQYLTELVMQEFKRVMRESQLPKKLKSYASNVMTITYRNLICNAHTVKETPK